MKAFRKVTGIVSFAAIATVVSLPGLAQVNPSPSIFNEPRYDGQPSGAGSIAPATTPSLSGTNPRPSIFNEPRYDGIPSPDATLAAPAATPSLSEVNPSPNVLAEPRYDGVPGTAAPMSSTAMQLTSLDREFMRMAAHSDQFEIQSSQLALQKSNNPEVRAYAEMMIQEHTLSSQRLSAIAAQYGVALPTAPNEFQQAVIEQLSTLSDAEFDRAYMEAQANGHALTAAVYRTQVGQGAAPDVRSFAAQILPVVEQHYQVASSMVQNYAQDPQRPVQ